MNFLQLCQMVASESGTISGTQPSATTGQSGRLEKVVTWTASAWRQIQNARSHWRWMYGEFGDANCVTSAGSARYTPASWNLSRLARWVSTPDEPITIYLEATGQSDETELEEIDWPTFRRLYDRRTHDSNRPIHCAISPTNELCLGPTPDDTYRVRGTYYKTPQDLEEDSDVPECPARFHEIIAHYGLLLLAEHDEGEYHTQVAYRRYKELWNDLRRDQAPRIRTADALA